MFTFPTLRSTLFFIAAWGVFLAVAASVTSASTYVVLGGVLLGGFAGFMETQALRSLARGLSNSSKDFQGRRKAVLATWPGKLFLGAELLCVLLAIAAAVLQGSASALAVIPAFGLARHGLVLLAYILPSLGNRANSA